MHLFPAKFKSASLLTAIIDTAQSFRYSDVFFARDLFVLLYKEGKGLPSDERIKELVKRYSTGRHAVLGKERISMTLRKRRQQLSELSTSKIFRAVLLSSGDIMEKYRDLLLIMRKMSMKAQQVVCATCSFSTQCGFAKRYMHSAVDLKQVIDPDYKKLVHPSCPALPDLDMANSMKEAMDMFFNGKTKEEIDRYLDELLSLLPRDTAVTFNDDDEETEAVVSVGDGSKSPYLRRATFGAAPLFQRIDTIISQLSVADLVLYQLSRNLAKMLAASYKGKYKPKAPVVVEKDIETMQEMSDVVHGLPSELGQEDDVVDSKIAKKTLAVRQDIGREEKPQIFFLALDTSGSMRNSMGGKSMLGTFMVSRAQVASIFAISIARHVIEEKGEFVVSFFDVKPTDPFVVKDKESLKKFEDLIAMNNFYGSGTNIDAVLQLGEKFIRTSKDKYSDAEILIITDMDSSVNDAVASLFSGPNSVRLNCLDIKAEAQDWGNARERLKLLSRNYCKVNFGELDATKLVAVLK